MTLQTLQGIQWCIFTNIYYKIFSEYFSTILVHKHVPRKTHTVGERSVIHNVRTLFEVLLAAQLLITFHCNSLRYCST